jgi:hypothetical protein
MLLAGFLCSRFIIFRGARVLFIVYRTRRLASRTQAVPVESRAVERAPSASRESHITALITPGRVHGTSRAERRGSPINVSGAGRRSARPRDGAARWSMVDRRGARDPGRMLGLA